MNASKFLAAIAVFATVSGTAFAADTAAAAAAVTVAASTATTSITATSLNVPVVTINKNIARSEVHAEAVEFVRNHKTALAITLEHAKN